MKCVLFSEISGQTSWKTSDRCNVLATILNIIKGKRWAVNTYGAQFKTKLLEGVLVGRARGRRNWNVDVSTVGVVALAEDKLHRIHNTAPDLTSIWKMTN
jgi:hypothetical protein